MPLVWGQISSFCLFLVVLPETECWIKGYRADGALEHAASPVCCWRARRGISQGRCVDHANIGLVPYHQWKRASTHHSSLCPRALNKALVHHGPRSTDGLYEATVLLVSTYPQQLSSRSLPLYPRLPDPKNINLIAKTCRDVPFAKTQYQHCHQTYGAPRKSPHNDPISKTQYQHRCESSGWHPRESRG